MRAISASASVQVVIAAAMNGSSSNQTNRRTMPSMSSAWLPPARKPIRAASTSGRGCCSDSRAMRSPSGTASARSKAW